MASKDLKCKRCPNLIYRNSLTGLCQSCFHADLGKRRLTSEKRIAAGTPTSEDRLRLDNTELRATLSSQSNVIKQYQEKQKFEDRLVKEVREYIEGSPYRPVLRSVKRAKSGGKASPHEMLASVSDAHFPEVVDPAQTFGLSYNADICQRRIEYLRDTIIRYVDLRRSAYPVSKLTLGINGDMVSGDIHEELEVTNGMPTSESVVKMAYILFDFASQLSEEVEEIELIVMPGNHPRLHKKPRFKQKWNNWEWVMGKFIEALAAKRFKVTVPKDLVYQFDVCGRRVGMTHGDGQKVQAYAGIPWYGMEKRRTKLQALLKQLKIQQLDLLMYGHFHQLIFEEGQGCSLFINGSIKGGDEYTTGAMYAAQEPVQGLLTFHPKHGITDVSRINLGHIK